MMLCNERRINVLSIYLSIFAFQNINHLLNVDHTVEQEFLEQLLYLSFMPLTGRLIANISVLI